MHNQDTHSRDCSQSSTHGLKWHHTQGTYSQKWVNQSNPSKQSKQTEEPVVPKIKWNTDPIKLKGKVHKLPITKDYILKEYSDVSKGVGTWPGGPYHIRTEETVQISSTPHGQSQ